MGRIDNKELNKTSGLELLIAQITIPTTIILTALGTIDIGIYYMEKTDSYNSGLTKLSIGAITGAISYYLINKIIKKEDSK